MRREKGLKQSLLKKVYFWMFGKVFWQLLSDLTFEFQVSGISEKKILFSSSISLSNKGFALRKLVLIRFFVKNASYII